MERSTIGSNNKDGVETKMAFHIQDGWHPILSKFSYLSSLFPTPRSLFTSFPVISLYNSPLKYLVAHVYILLHSSTIISSLLLAAFIFSSHNSPWPKTLARSPCFLLLYVCKRPSRNHITIKGRKDINTFKLAFTFAHPL